MKPILLACIMWMFLGLGAAAAETRTLELKVHAGKHNREEVPVRVPLTLPAAQAKPRVVLLEGPDGLKLPAQLTAPGLLTESAPEDGKGTRRELHFIVPSLKAGATLTLKLDLAGSEPGKDARPFFAWHDTPGKFAELRLGTQPVLRYMYQPLDDSSKGSRDLTYKVYHHLYDPSGRRFVTNGPSGLYPHHRGLFYGFNHISYGDGKKADVWHCTGDAYQSHERFLSSEAGPILGRHRVEIAWHGPGKEVFAREERELTVYNVPGGDLAEFASRLWSTVGKVKLDGDPQHAGFHFRADNEVAAKSSKETYFLRPDGPGKLGETRNWDPKTQKGPVNLPWNAMSFVLGKERFTVAYLDKPTNPKEARFSEREYGRIGSYFEYELDTDRPLTIDYRIWLQGGELTVGDVAAHSANFVQPLEVTVTPSRP
jgi:hypothetical protein